MCDEQQLAAMDRAGGAGLNRRQFTRMGAMLGAGATMAACSTTSQAQGGLVENPVSFAAPGGTMDGFFVHQAGTSSPGVIMWPDIAGLREA